jgi:hypothetical protein
MPDDIEKLAKHDPDELSDKDGPIDINDQWENVEIGDQVGIDPIEGGGIGTVTKLENDEVTVELEDGTEWTGDVNSVINTGTLEDEKQEDDFIPMSGFDAAINQQFSDLIDDV